MSADTTRCQFRKHQGKSWGEVLREDRAYVEWLVSMNGPPISDELYEHLVELLEESGEE